MKSFGVPQAFPNMYLWTTYGLVSLLEELWAGQISAIHKRAQISPYVIEVVSMLERALAMAFTGDARVITKDLMGPFGLKRSLLEHGLPSIIKILNFDKSITSTF